MKKLMAILLALMLLASVFPLSAFGADSPVRLLEIYGNDMIFQQGQPIRLAGFAPVGTLLDAELYNGGTLLSRTGGQAGADGMFELFLPGLPGSYSEYRIEVSSGGQTVAELERVLFGELWLAGGQSNMDWQFGGTPEGYAAQKNGVQPERPYIRMLYTPAHPEYEGDPMKLPLYPQEDIKGARWARGDSFWDVNGFSAIAWSFACKLQDEINMPVGVIGASLGGSSIYTWLSREAIDADPLVKKDVDTLWRYLPASKWGSYEKADHQQTMTANYNKRIYALRHLNPAGLIWYQGETELISYISNGIEWDEGNAYKRALTLLQESWADLFGKPSLPIVCTNLAGYAYSQKQPEQPGLF
ncbi:MAG: sialate O-acetylesterase, partial [Oscillospiraceae bacterium]|nr:sialate O-acetylesterase [Oscillospiraceae bacterium]